MNVFVFDIETIPDIASARKIYGYESLNDEEVVMALQLARRQQTAGSEFLPHYLQKIVCISAVYHSENQIKVWSLGTEEAEEAQIIQRFHNGLDKYQPTLVSWNGTGFDCPVINYRTLVHGINASRYWETGDNDQSYRWNNYQNRYHGRHTDVMDLLSAYQPRASAPLDKIATMLGFPGKMGMSGARVWETYQAGQINAIRDYCETDVLNTYLVYLRFELMRGKVSEQDYQQALARLRTYLQAEQLPHFDEFLQNWPVEESIQELAVHE